MTGLINEKNERTRAISRAFLTSTGKWQFIAFSSSSRDIHPVIGNNPLLNVQISPLPAAGNPGC